MTEREREELGDAIYRALETGTDPDEIRSEVEYVLENWEDEGY